MIMFRLCFVWCGKPRFDKKIQLRWMQVCQCVTVCVDWTLLSFCLLYQRLPFVDTHHSKTPLTHEPTAQLSERPKFEKGKSYSYFEDLKRVREEESSAQDKGDLILYIWFLVTLSRTMRKV